MASSYILWEEGYINKNESIDFHAKGGDLTVKMTTDGIQMDFPALQPTLVKEFNSSLLSNLKLSPLNIYQFENDIVYELSSESEVQTYSPHFSFLKTLPYRSHIITTKSSQANYDFISRVFAPSVGINEDPATGIAHCILGPLWTHKLNKKRLTALQVSSRGAYFDIKTLDNLIQLKGHAKLMLKGTFFG